MSSSSPPRLGVRFLPTIPSAADSSIILDDTEDSGNDNSVELLSRQESNESEGFIVIASHELERRDEEEEQQQRPEGVSLVVEQVEVGDHKDGNCSESKDNNNSTRQGSEEIVVNLAQVEEYMDDCDEEEEDEEDGGLEMRLGATEPLRTEKRGSGDSSAAGTYQAFYTVLGNGGNILATLENPKDVEKKPP